MDNGHGKILSDLKKFPFIPEIFQEKERTLSWDYWSEIMTEMTPDIMAAVTARLEEQVISNNKYGKVKK